MTKRRKNKGREREAQGGLTETNKASGEPTTAAGSGWLTAALRAMTAAGSRQGRKLALRWNREAAHARAWLL